VESGVMCSLASVRNVSLVHWKNRLEAVLSPKSLRPKSDMMVLFGSVGWFGLVWDEVGIEVVELMEEERDEVHRGLYGLCPRDATSLANIVQSAKL
jgi:hypothetical protein